MNAVLFFNQRAALQAVIDGKPLQCLGVLYHETLFPVINNSLLNTAPNDAIDTAQRRPYLRDQFLLGKAGKLSSAVIAPNAAQHPLPNRQQSNARHGIGSNIHTAGEHPTKIQVKIKDLAHPVECRFLIHYQYAAGGFCPHLIGLVFGREDLYLTEHLARGKGIDDNGVAVALFLLHLYHTGADNIKTAGGHLTGRNDARPRRIFPLLKFLSDLRRSRCCQLQNINCHNSLPKKQTAGSSFISITFYRAAEKGHLQDYAALCACNRYEIKEKRKNEKEKIK